MLTENAEYEPGRTLSFIAHEPNGVALRTTFSFQKIESLHTRVALAAEGDGRALGGLGRRLAKREVEALRDLKRTLESCPFTL